MITRIVMDKEVNTPSRTFAVGEIYDSRLPPDSADAEGKRHYIERHRAELFVAQGWAHEQTAEEWFARLDQRRKDTLSDPSTDADAKELIRRQNAYAASAAWLTSLNEDTARRMAI